MASSKSKAQACLDDNYRIFDSWRGVGTREGLQHDALGDAVPKFWAALKNYNR